MKSENKLKFTKVFLYKGYMANVKFNEDCNAYYCETMNTEKTSNFEGKTLSEIKKAFHEFVDKHLEEKEKVNG